LALSFIFQLNTDTAVPEFLRSARYNKHACSSSGGEAPFVMNNQCEQ
jgi:hypothetical protein